VHPPCVSKSLVSMIGRLQTRSQAMLQPRNLSPETCGKSDLYSCVRLLWVVGLGFRIQGISDLYSCVRLLWV